MSDIYENPFNDEVTESSSSDEYPTVFQDDCCNCRELFDSYVLIDSLMDEICGLEEEVLRWRKILIPYLPKDAAMRLQSDIFDNQAMRRSGEATYDAYLKAFGYKEDPLEDSRHRNIIRNILAGDDEHLQAIIANLNMK